LTIEGGNRLEASIQSEYIKLITEAKHFIYMENQVTFYFIAFFSNLNYSYHF